uniref:Acyltransferase 3 domain-containing protein n=1 Tax=Heliothis virescens TaxID=7102 RepID=A0A2A4JTY7_HELVI
MFPALATVILLQISIFNRVADGPFWVVVMTQTHTCRVYWWSTLLHIQNFVNPQHMCLLHSWYLAIDVQLYILSPLVLVWVLTGRKKLAWSALAGSLIAVLAAATTYNFIRNLPSGLLTPSRPLDSEDFFNKYYVNPLTRASPFVVGLIFGYILHLNRGKKVKINLILATILWICATVIALLIIYSFYPITQLDWDNQFADNMINSFMRPAWAMFVGWMIFACVHGYGGPVNWILSHRAWKVLSRLSYVMYLVHYPMQLIINAMPIVPIYFDIRFSLYRFLADFSLAVIVAYLITIIIDAPCSVLIKHFMGGGPKKPVKVLEDPETLENK